MQFLYAKISLANYCVAVIGQQIRASRETSRPDSQIRHAVPSSQILHNRLLPISPGKRGHSRDFGGYTNIDTLVRSVPALSPLISKAASKKPPCGGFFKFLCLGDVQAAVTPEPTKTILPPKNFPHSFPHSKIPHRSWRGFLRPFHSP